MWISHTPFVTVRGGALSACIHPYANRDRHTRGESANITAKEYRALQGHVHSLCAAMRNSPSSWHARSVPDITNLANTPRDVPHDAECFPAELSLRCVCKVGPHKICAGVPPELTLAGLRAATWCPFAPHGPAIRLWLGGLLRWKTVLCHTHMELPSQNTKQAKPETSDPRYRHMEYMRMVYCLAELWPLSRHCARPLYVAHI